MRTRERLLVQIYREAQTEVERFAKQYRCTDEQRKRMADVIEAVTGLGETILLREAWKIVKRTDRQQLKQLDALDEFLQRRNHAKS
jgi:hypothetical protein